MLPLDSRSPIPRRNADMSAVNEELNMKVYEKLFDGQEKYKEWLLTQPPEEILNHA